MSSYLNQIAKLFYGEGDTYGEIEDNSNNFYSEGKLQLEPPEIQSVINDFLRRCGMVYPVTERHAEFEAECVAQSIERGYITPEDDSFRQFIPGGVSMACNAYAHLPDRKIQIYTCIYTAFLIYLDDMFGDDIDAVREFNGRFCARQPQKHKILDHFADLILDMPSIFGTVVANIMTTSTLNLVTALSLEYEVEGTKLESSAVAFPTFSRVMSGASETYALFMFPPELPIKSYIQALPDLMVYINNGNDILSFYKEEMAGETVNRIHLIAKCLDVPQSLVLRGLVDDAVAAHLRILNILKPHKGSYDAYKKFCQGYVGFHAGLKRYRLNELGF